MKITEFKSESLRDLWRPGENTVKFDGGQVTIVGGSELFHGAPVLALEAASRLVSMVYFVTPPADKAMVEKIKGRLSSFIWIPLEELEYYIEKSDVVLVGPGMMRNTIGKDGWSCDYSGRLSRELTLRVIKSVNLNKQKLVVDGGSLQVINVEDLPEGAVITPNRKEFQMLFKESLSEEPEVVVDQVFRKAKAFGLTIVHKGPEYVISDGENVVIVRGGDPGMAKGGMGDVFAGLVAGLLAKNEKMLGVISAAYFIKKTAEEVASRQGIMYNSDDIARMLPAIYQRLATKSECGVDIYRS